MPRGQAAARAGTQIPGAARNADRERYFLFLRWIRVLFSSLRCFFFAIRLRRFLMTEPIRPPSSSAQRQTGTPSRSPRNAYRSRSPLAYLLPHSGVTAWSAIGAQSPVADA
jgi:hypothetical protein